MPLRGHGRRARLSRRWAAGIRVRAADEGGAILVITAIMIVSFIGLAALAIDIGSFYQAQRQTQAAADAGALAGADALAAGSSTAAASTTASALASTNDSAASTPTVNITSSAGIGSVTVNVQAHTPSYFGQIFGSNGADVSSRAVAQTTATTTPCTTPGANCYAIFASDQSCPNGGVTLNAGAIHITGAVHSNSSITKTGNDTLSSATYGPTASGCTSNAAGATSGPVITTWPIDYGAAPYYPACAATGAYTCGAADPSCGTTITCTGPTQVPSYCTQVFWGATVSQPSYPSGIVCAPGTTTRPSDPSTWNGALTIAGSNAGTSFIAGTVATSGAGQTTLSPASGIKMVIYAAAASTSAVSLNGGGLSVTGDIFAPKGTIAVNSGNNSTNFLEGKDVSLNAGSMSITGDGPVQTGGGTTYGSSSLIQ